MDANVVEAGVDVFFDPLNMVVGIRAADDRPCDIVFSHRLGRVLEMRGRREFRSDPGHGGVGPLFVRGAARLGFVLGPADGDFGVLRLPLAARFFEVPDVVRCRPDPDEAVADPPGRLRRAQGASGNVNRRQFVGQREYLAVLDGVVRSVVLCSSPS